MSCVQTDGNQRTSIILVKFGRQSYPDVTGMVVGHSFQSIGQESYTQSRRLQGLPVASGHFQHRSIVSFFQPPTRSSGRRWLLPAPQESPPSTRPLQAPEHCWLLPVPPTFCTTCRLAQTGATVKSLPL